MINSTKRIFSKIFSIELDKYLYERAKRKFSNANHISILYGDSSVVLPNILTNITEPCLFWLDAHYSGGITAKGKTDTPIWQELLHILKYHNNEKSIILIDDARLFGQGDYPSIEEIRNLISQKRPNWIIQVKNDIIWIYKKVSKIK